MERTPRIDKQQEGTAKPTEKARNSSFSKKLLVEKYIYQEQPDDQRELHGDPRSKLAQQSHGQHQDSDLISSDGDPESLHPACGIGATSDHYASDSFVGDQGTLAGGYWGYRDKNGEYKERETSSSTDQRVVNWFNKANARHAPTPYHSARTSDFGSSGYHTCEDTQ
jgi:hypothetical protein